MFGDLYCYITATYVFGWAMSRTPRFGTLDFRQLMATKTIANNSNSNNFVAGNFPPKADAELHLGSRSNTSGFVTKNGGIFSWFWNGGNDSMMMNWFVKLNKKLYSTFWIGLWICSTEFFAGKCMFIGSAQRFFFGDFWGYQLWRPQKLCSPHLQLCSLSC